MRGSPKRSYVNKSHSARQFRNKVSVTKAINIRPQPMRGGFRL